MFVVWRLFTSRRMGYFLCRSFWCFLVLVIFGTIRRHHLFSSDGRRRDWFCARTEWFGCVFCSSLWSFTGGQCSGIAVRRRRGWWFGGGKETKSRFDFDAIMAYVGYMIVAVVAACIGSSLATAVALCSSTLRNDVGI